jgi:hypothetical protein
MLYLLSIYNFLLKERAHLLGMVTLPIISVTQWVIGRKFPLAQTKSESLSGKQPKVKKA